MQRIRYLRAGVLRWTAQDEPWRVSAACIEIFRLTEREQVVFWEAVAPLFATQRGALGEALFDLIGYTGSRMLIRMYCGK